MSSENNRKLVKYGLPLSSAIKKEESSGSDCSRRVSHIQSTFKNVAVGLSDDALRKATSKSDLKIIEKSKKNAIVSSFLRCEIIPFGSFHVFVLF